MTERERRIGENEAIFRVVNDKIDELNRAFADTVQTMQIICECGDIECTAQIVLSVPDYERVRADPTLFVTLPGHVIPDVEDVVESNEDFDVVRKKPGDPADVARKTDPRR